jgi:hypothetical protein
MRKKWGKWSHFNMARSESVFRQKFVVDERTGCWQWTGSMHSSKRYGSVGLMGRHLLAHRAAWMIFKGFDPEEQCVCHKCDNGFCVNPDHLFIGTQTDNIHDMERKKRSYHPFHENHGRAKLTMRDVKKMRSLHKKGMAIRAISRMYPHVNRATVASAINGKTWN